jgi:hypothetical protein
MFDHRTALEVIKRAVLKGREEKFKKEVSKNDFRGVRFYGWVSSDGVFSVSLFYGDHRYHEELSQDFESEELIAAVDRIRSRVLKREAMELKERFSKKAEVIQVILRNIELSKLIQLEAQHNTQHNLGYEDSLLYVVVQNCLKDQEPVLSLQELKKLVPTYRYRGTPFSIHAATFTTGRIYLHYASRLSVIGRTVELKTPITKTVVEDAIKAIVAKESANEH